MLVVKNIRVQFEKNVIPIKIKKISIGYKDTLLSNKKKYQQLDSHTFQWPEDITLPLFYNVPLSYNCKVDQDLYNPEDPNFNLSGSLKIVDYRASSQEGIVYNKQNRKVATIILSYRVSNEKMIIPQQKGLVVISSILAHINNLNGTQGFIEISLDNKQIFTPTVKVIAGELLWAEQLTLPVQQIEETTKNKHEIVFSVYIDDQLTGKGGFSLTAMQKNNLKYKKFDILSNQNKEKIGTLFIDVVVKNRNALNEASASKIRNEISEALNHKRRTEQILSKRQPSQNFFNKKQATDKDFQIPIGVKSSRSESKLPHHSYNAEQTAKILQKYNNKKKKNYDIFDQIFNYGDLSKKQQDIRQVLRDRRKKGEVEGSLPKLR